MILLIVAQSTPIDHSFIKRKKRPRKNIPKSHILMNSEKTFPLELPPCGSLWNINVKQALIAFIENN
jgi:hypothetical protein